MICAGTIFAQVARPDETLRRRVPATIWVPPASAGARFLARHPLPTFWDEPPSRWRDLLAGALDALTAAARRLGL